MAGRVEIADRESAEAWLETQDHQTQVWFASRCALRALPSIGSWGQATKSGLALASLRAVLISAAAATCPIKRVRELLNASRAATNVASVERTSLSANDAAASPTILATAISAARAVAAMPPNDNSAPRNARSTAKYAARALPTSYPQHISAASSDAGTPGNWSKLWGATVPSPEFSQSWTSLKAQWYNDAVDWTFWIDWYEAVRDGTWTDWDLIFKLATILTDRDWDKGAAHVAVRIAEIRKDSESELLDQDALQAHAQKLAQHPVLNADIARSAGQQIESIVQSFKAEAPANQLPNGFETFESLPPTFFAISAAFMVTTAEAPDRAALQEEINRLHGVIAQLRSDLHEAKLQLLDARLTASEAQQIRTFGETAATTLTSIVSLGVIAGGMAWFFGVPENELRYDALKERLNGLVEEMEKAQPSPDTDTLPPATEV